MKTEFIDVSDTQKNLVVEIPSTVVDAEIDKVARDYSRAARVPGFRPGKVPAKVVRQRFRDQILHDVAHGLIPRAVDEGLRERGGGTGDTPGRWGGGGGEGAAGRWAPARARRAPRRHPGHSGRGRRRRAAAEVHGNLRDGSSHRPWRL